MAHPTPAKELLFIDMDGVLVDFVSSILKYYPDFNGLPESRRREITAELSGQPGFFTSMEPMPGAIEAYRKLSRHYDIYILSTPDWQGVHSWTEKRIWVEKHLGELAYKKLILSHNKGLFTGRALIDDRIRNGVENFKGEHIHFGTKKFPGWPEVLQYLSKPHHGNVLQRLE
jgi:5'-nucleotidase